jgi:hypothetical protein
MKENISLPNDRRFLSGAADGYCAAARRHGQRQLLAIYSRWAEACRLQLKSKHRLQGTIMTKQAKNVISRMTIAMMTALIGACSGAPGESDFVTACIEEGQRGVNRAFTKEMGIDRETFCKCAAKEASATLSADAQRAMILDMQGKAQEAGAISSKMSESEQMAFMKGGVEVFEKCARAAGAK